MGANMATNLLKTFKEVHVFDVVEANVAALEQKGAKRSASVEELAATCSTIITMLPATQHVSNVLKGPKGIFAIAKPNTLIIDCSTIDPVVSKELNAEAVAAGHRMVDAPVSGGVAGATAGTLTFMVGGDGRTFEECQQFLQAMGKNMVLVGGPGSGGVTKICNNLSLAISMVGTAEAMNLGRRLGMDPKTLAGVLNTSTGRCWASEVNNPCPGVLDNVPASRGYTGGFAAALMYKDLGLAMDVAHGAGANIVPVGDVVHGIYGSLVNDGYGGKDFSVVFEPLASPNGLLTTDQKEIAALRAENKKLQEQLAALNK
ncbi:hibA [Symbiodinium microadriaticum]|nr:hibA [Symbiodinium microadriaticum]